ncbi:uncharacterized protein Fot_37835 [Forsythia ovata]|uniref:Uncharacterized protein n=1 Tax=Forsythia ovata TaxID=205694 RepID=A0ABD1S2D1_9LAMI
MEYLIIDKSSLYHGDLGKPALIDLCNVTYTKFLCMKNSTDCRIAIVKENQSESRSCYTNAMRKFVDRGVHMIGIEMVKVESDLEKMDETRDGDRDVRIREPEDPSGLDL